MGASDTIDLNRPRTTREILRAAVGLYRAYPLLFAILALGVIAPYDLLVTALTGSGPLVSSAHESVGTVALLDLLNFSLVGPFISALHMHAVILISEDQRPRLEAVAIRGLRVLPVVVAAEIIAGLGIALGFVALIIPGILLSLRWSVVAQTAAVEHEGWLPALRRSGVLTANQYLHIFGLLLATGFLSFVAGTASTSLQSGGSGSLGSVLIEIAFHTVAASFTALALAILYLDLRARNADPRAGRPPQHGHPRDLD
jgi:hypothetical protein